MADLSQCTIGTTDGSPCHLKTFSRKQGLHSINDFSAEDQKLLALRGGLELNQDSVVCYHHENTLLKKYEFLQRECCNAFECHGDKRVIKGLRITEIELAEKINEAKQMVLVKPGQKLCRDCRRFAEKLLEPLTGSSGSESDEIKKKKENKAVNASFAAVGISPLKLQQVSRRDSPGYARRKLAQTQNVLAEKLASASGIDPTQLQSSSTSKLCESCRDYRTLLEELKERLKVSAATRAEKLQILTLAPDG